MCVGVCGVCVCVCVRALVDFFLSIRLKSTFLYRFYTSESKSVSFFEVESRSAFSMPLSHFPYYYLFLYFPLLLFNDLNCVFCISILSYSFSIHNHNLFFTILFLHFLTLHTFWLT